MRYNTSESTSCPNCGQFIRWSSSNETDLEYFSGVYGKLRYHQKHDKQCTRQTKLDELLGKDEEPKRKKLLNLTFLDEEKA